MTYSDIVKVLRDYGPVEGSFVATRLGLSVAETRRYLVALERAGIIKHFGGSFVLADSDGSRSTPKS